MIRTFELGYRPALDGLRGVSIACVLGFHAGIPGFAGGSLGVDAFFVLSGFLITALLEREWQAGGSISLRKFYARRALRLLPAVGLLLAILYGFSLTLADSPNVDQLHRELLYTLFYVSNWALAFDLMRPLGFLGHTWSLAIEEQFYFVWPPILLLLLRSGWTRPARAMFVALAGLGSVALCAALWTGSGSIARPFYGFDTRAQSLLAGCVLGLLASWGALPVASRFRGLRTVSTAAAVALFAAFVGFSSSTDPHMYRGGFALVSIAVAFVIMDVWVDPDGVPARILSVRPLAALGRISYGLYLWHWPVFVYVNLYRIDRPFAFIVAVQILVSVAVAVVSYFCVERPFLKLKSRFEPVLPEPAPE